MGYVGDDLQKTVGGLVKFGSLIVYECPDQVIEYGRAQQAEGVFSEGVNTADQKIIQLLARINELSYESLVF